MFGKAAQILTVVSVAVLTGCASVPEASPELDKSAKTFEAPRDKAGVYVYRNETMGAAVKLHVLLDDKYLGETASKTYFYVEIEPGTHTVTGKAENESSVRFHALAGRLYYIWQEIKMGLFQPRNELKLVEESEGRAGVLESRRIATK